MSVRSVLGDFLIGNEINIADIIIGYKEGLEFVDKLNTSFKITWAGWDHGCGMILNGEDPLSDIADIEFDRCGVDGADGIELHSQFHHYINAQKGYKYILYIGFFDSMMRYNLSQMMIDRMKYVQKTGNTKKIMDCEYYPVN